MSQHAVHIRRVYEDAKRGDGVRILVDRVWPRGVRKDELEYDEWVKEVAPSTELRKWFGHDPAKFEQFQQRYRDELHNDDSKQDALNQLRKILHDSPLTLLTATKDVPHSHAAVLAELLRNGG